MLYYGVNSSFCTSINNSMAVKNAAMSKIIQYASPDIIAVNEMGPQEYHHDFLLANSLDIAWPGRYLRAGFSNINASDLVNDLYYDHSKLVLKDRYGIYSAVRDADAYLFYLKPVAEDTDTIFLMHVVTHLKAGSTASDQQSRSVQSADIMAWLSNHNYRGNLILSGDFNMKSSYEQAWYNFTQYPEASVRLFDPPDASGQWSDNWSYRMLHSQSSRTSTSGCGSGGGLDDRFDVILLNSNLMQGTSGLMYVSDSYLTIGQDGIRLNESVTNPANLQVPDSIAFALEEVSDHLPVMLKLVTQDATGIDAGQANFSHITAITGGNGTLGLRSNRPTPPFYAYLTGMDGRIHWQGSLDTSSQGVVWIPATFPTGIYVIRIQGAEPLRMKVVVF